MSILGIVSQLLLCPTINGDRLLELYEGGEQPCLFAILLSGSARDTFHVQVQRLFETWIAAIAEVLMAEGMEANMAKQ